MEKTIMIQVMGRIYVGKETNDTEYNGLNDAYEFLPIATLTNMDGKMATLSTNAMIKVGEITQIPDEAVIAELSGDSPYYKDYVKATTGITPAKPDDIFKKNKIS
jgi:hypothetical protein